MKITHLRLGTIIHSVLLGAELSIVGVLAENTNFNCTHNCVVTGQNEGEFYAAFLPEDLEYKKDDYTEVETEFDLNAQVTLTDSGVSGHISDIYINDVGVHYAISWLDSDDVKYRKWVGAGRIDTVTALVA